MSARCLSLTVRGGRAAQRVSTRACSSHSVVASRTRSMFSTANGAYNGTPQCASRPWQLHFRRAKTTLGLKEDFPVPQHLARGRANPWRPKTDPSDPEYGSSFTVRRLKKHLFGAMEKQAPSYDDMMEPQPLYAHMRDTSGKYVAKHLRSFGFVPGSVQGSTVADHMRIYINSSQVCREVRRAKYSFQCRLYNLHIEGIKDPMLVLARQYMRNDVTLELQNVTFVRYIPGQRYRLQLPIRLVGEEDNYTIQKEDIQPVVIKPLLDCYWRQPTDKICTPPHLVLDIKNIKKGQVYHVSKLKFPEGLTPCYPDINYALISMKAKRR